MIQQLHFLHLEDNKTDAELIKELLLLNEIPCEITLIDNQNDFIKNLKEKNFDLILADYNLPSFDGFSALDLGKKYSKDTPFILISGVMGEELAIEALKKGATDYVLKSRMERLIPAIQRALREKEERAQRLLLEREIVELEQTIDSLKNTYQELTKRVRGFLKIELPSGKYSIVDKFLEDLSGYQIKYWQEKPNFIEQIIHSSYLKYYTDNFNQMREGIVPKMLEYRIIRKDGEERWWLQFNIGAFDIEGKLTSVSAVIIDNTDDKETQLRYQNLYENALTGLYRSDIYTGEILEANEKMAKMFGCKSIAELKKYQAKDFYPDISNRDEFIENIKKTGYLEEYLTQYKKLDDSLFWVSESSRVDLEKGYLEGILIDVTDKKLAETALLRDRKAFLEIAKAAIHSKSIKELCQLIINALVDVFEFSFGTIRLYDPKNELLIPYAMTGFKEEDKDKITPIPFNHPTHMGAMVARNKEPIFTSDVEKAGLTNIKPLIESIVVKANITWPIISANKDLIGVLQLVSSTPKEIPENDKILFETIGDMFAAALEHKKAEEALKESEEKMKRLTNIIVSSDEVVISADPRGKIIYANPAIEKIFGYKIDEILGQPISILAPESFLDQQKEIFEKAKQFEKVTYETFRKHKNGSLIPVVISVTSNIDQSGTILSVNSVMLNISEIKKLEESLKSQYFEFELLNKVISAGYRAKNLDQFLDFFLNIILDSLDFTGGAVYLTDKMEGTAEIKKSLGMPKSFLENIIKVKLNSPQFKRLFISGQTIILENFKAMEPEHALLEIETIMSVPFYSKDEIIGAVMLTSKERREIKAEDKRILEVVGRNIGTAITKFIAEEELVQRQGNLQLTFDSIEDILVVIDIETNNILISNKAALKVINTPEIKSQKITIFDLIPSKFLKENKNLLGELYKGNIKSMKIPLLTKEQKTRIFEMKSYIQKHGNRNVVICIFRSVD